MNSLRRHNRGFELAFQIIGIGFLAAFAVGTGIGFYAACWAALKYDRVYVLNFLLWGVFLVWQLAPVLFEGFSPGLNFREIARYPISFRLYFFLNSAYGLLDPAAVVSVLWLFSIWMGIITGRPQWALPAAALFLVFMVFNILCNRVVINLFDRFQSSRKGRERMVVILLLLMLLPQAIQFINFEKLARSADYGPFMKVFNPVNRMSPPGALFESLTSPGIEKLLPMVLLAAYCLLVFFLMLWQSKAIYQGEIHAEGSGRRREKLKVSPGWALPGIDSTISAVFEKEIRYIRQNLRIMVQLAYPVLIFLFIFFSKSQHRRNNPFAMVFGGAGPVGALALFASFSLLGMSNLAYNIFGMDHEGFGRWMLCPQPLRKIIFAKNLSHGVIFASLYLIVSLLLVVIMGIPLLPFLTITLASFAVMITQFAAGNLLSAYWPKKIDPTQMSSRLISTGAGIASLLIIAPIGIMVAAVMGASMFWHLQWLPLLASVAGLAVSIVLYSVLLTNAANYVYEHLEEMEGALSKSV